MSTPRPLTQHAPQDLGTPWLDTRRQAAFSEVQDLGLPTRKDEDWKYSDPRALRDVPFADAPETADVEGLFAEAKIGERLSAEVWMINGRHVGDVTHGPAVGSVSVYSLDAEDIPPALLPRLERTIFEGPSGRTHAFERLNHALFGRGVVIHVTKSLDAPVAVTIATHGDGARAATFPKVVVLLDEGVSATVVEQHVSAADDESLCNAAVHVDLAPRAKLTHHLWQRLAAGTSLVHTARAHLDQEARYDVVALHLGAAYARSWVETQLVGEQAETHYHGLLLGAGKAHLDVHSVFDHQVSHCTSRQLVKAILGDASHGVFNGKVIFREGAQKSDTAQANHNLLLSRDAEIDTKPELEIYADDVKASHGSTVGQLDEEPVFYLRSRGIDKAEAQRMLTFAFAQDILEHIADETLDAFIHPRIDARLAAMLDGNLP